jgi:hypothetical protein
VAETDSRPGTDARSVTRDDATINAILAATGGIMTSVAVAAALAAFAAPPGLAGVAMAATTGVLAARTANTFACVIVVLAAIGLFLVVLAGPDAAAWPETILLGVGALLGRCQRWMRHPADD